MKALSLWQPWASLWLSPAKVHETRHWATKYRGPLLVHAAKTVPSAFQGCELADICVREFGADWRRTLPRGVLLGRVHLIDMVSTDVFSPVQANTDFVCGNWARGRWGWKRDEHYDLFRHPIPFTGRQRIFEVPVDPL